MCGFILWFWNSEQCRGSPVFPGPEEKFSFWNGVMWNNYLNRAQYKSDTYAVNASFQCNTSYSSTSRPHQSALPLTYLSIFYSWLFRRNFSYSFPLVFLSSQELSLKLCQCGLFSGYHLSSALSDSSTSLTASKHQFNSGFSRGKEPIGIDRKSFIIKDGLMQSQKLKSSTTCL